MAALTQTPQRGKIVYMAAVTAPEYYHKFWWYGDEPESRWLECGLVFSTKDEAICKARNMVNWA